MKQNEPLTHINAIIGLGNPGDRYYYTRHSIGFRIVDEIVKKCEGTWHDRGILQTAEVEIHERPILIIKSNTYMNDSGKVIPYILKKGIKPEEVLVVHDELEKRFGTFALKKGGSHRGHNGLRSIIGLLGDGFYRLRIGIGRPEHKEDVPEYVLEKFQYVAAEVEMIISEAVEFLIDSL